MTRTKLLRPGRFGIISTKKEIFPGDLINYEIFLFAIKTVFRMSTCLILNN